MSLFNDFATYVGVPAGGVTAAMAIYAGCIAAEKEARREALADIHAYIFSREISNVNTANIIKRIFNYTFGFNHFSARCFFASALATLLFVVALALQFSITTGIYPDPSDYIAGGIYVFFVTVIMIDYVSLYKSRKLIYLSSRFNKPPIVFVLCDIIITTLILNIVSYSLKSVIFGEFVDPSKHAWAFFSVMTGEFLELFRHDLDFFPSDAITIASTYLTTFWTMMIASSAYILRVISPVQRFVCWFFDTKEHPIKVIGFVASGVVLAASLLWTII